jgi:hypothetical protein
LRHFIPFEPAHLGRHWSPTEEFDLVALDGERRRAFVADIKWSLDPISTSLASDLQKRIAGCSALQGLEVTPALISRQGFSGKRLSGTTFIDLSVLHA